MVRSVVECVILIGLPGSGKTTFYRTRLSETHRHVSKDLMKNVARRGARQAALVDAALKEGVSVVVDNTNPTPVDRAPLIAQARQHGARVIGYFFDESVAECLKRNRERTGRSRVPDVAIFVAAKKLVAPSSGEGFDELYRVKVAAGDAFEINRI